MPRRVRTTPRKRPRQARSKATVDAILEATAQVLVAEGYDKTSTNRVAERAGVSVGSVYQYFPNKEALVGELVDRYSRDIMDLVFGRLTALADEPPEVVAPALVEAMIDFKTQDPRLARVLRDQIPRVGRMQRYEQQLAQTVDATRAYLERWRERLIHDDLDTVAFLAVHTVDAATHAGIVARPPLPRDALIAHVTDLVLSYLVGRPQEGTHGE
ncbi:MAG: TetR/AcrR family transcriptional regulator [Myxococcota bacterium]|nr:TetR/AcrR family transcriptional regulator [Myxococcota bacterium]